MDESLHVVPRIAFLAALALFIVLVACQGQTPTTAPTTAADR